MSNPKSRLQPRLSNGRFVSSTDDRDLWRWNESTRPARNMGVRSLSPVVRQRKSPKGGKGSASPQGNGKNTGATDQARNHKVVRQALLDIQWSLTSLSDRINEGNERLRIIEADIEKIQLHIGRLTTRN